MVNVGKRGEPGQVTKSLKCHPKKSRFSQSHQTLQFQEPSNNTIHFRNLTLQLIESPEARRLTIINHVFGEKQTWRIP